MATNDLKFSILVDTATGQVSLRQLDTTLRNTSTTAKDTAKSIETNWVNAFSRLSVIKETINGVKAAFGGLLESPLAFEQSLRNVGSLSEDVVANYDKISATLKQYGRELPVKSTKELADAMYQAVSAGFSWNDALQLVQQSAKGSVAGLSSVPESMNALISVMNAYQLSGKDSEMVMDKLFQTVRKGITTFPELAASMSQVAPKAATAGIGLDDMMASLVTITKMKVPTSEAMTKISSSISPLMQILGDGYFKLHTFQEGLQEVYKRANGSVSEIQKMMGRSEAADAVILIGRYAQQANQDLKDMTNSAGASGKAFQENASSVANSIQLFKNNFAALKNAALTALLPVIKEIVSGLTSFFRTLNNLPQPIRVLISGAALLKTAMIAVNLSGIRPLIASLTTLSYGLMSNLTSNFSGLAKVAMTSSTAFKALSLTLSVSLIGAFVAIIAYLPDIINFFSKVHSAADLNDVLEANEKQFDSLKETLDDLNKNTRPALEKYTELQTKVQKGEELTADERQTLLEVTKTLADKYPELVMGVDKTTGAYKLNSNALDILNKATSEAVARLDDYIKKQVEVVKQANENMASGGSTWDKITNFILNSTGNIEAANNQATRVIGENADVASKAQADSWRGFLEKISNTKSKADPDELIKAFQLQMGGAFISDDMWKKYKGQVIKVQAEINGFTKENNLTRLEELKAAYSQRKSVTNDLEDTELKSIRYSAEKYIAAQKGLSGQTKLELKKFFDLRRSGIGSGSSAVAKQAEIDLLSAYNTLYAKGVIQVNDYISKTNDLYEKAINDPKLVELQKKLFSGLTLSPQELDTLAKKSEAVSKITDAQEKVIKDIADKDYEAYQELAEKRKKGLEEVANVMKGVAGGQQGAIDLAEIKFNKGQINSKEYINALKDVMEDVKGIISIGGQDAVELLDKLSIGEATNDMINDVYLSLKETQPALAETFDEFVKTYKDASDKLNEIRQSDITGLGFWASQTATIVESISAGLGEALAGGFSVEGFKSMAQRVKEGFKIVLIAIADAIDKMYIGMSLYQLIEAFINPASLIVGAGKLLAMKVGIEAFKGLVSSFSTGGYAANSTLAVVGDTPGGEWMIPNRDLVTMVRGIVSDTRKNIPQVISSNNRVIFEVRNGAFKVAGRDLISQVEINQLYENKRYAY